MPFPMMHLCIAKKIADKIDIKNLPAFYLGNLAPDAVHFRQHYNSAFKKTSHLCTSPEKWGLVSDNAAWADNALSYLRANIQADNPGFLCGYIAHILSDIYNNIHSWMPFRQRHPDVLLPGVANIHHEEANLVDQALYRACEYRGMLWHNLAKVPAIGLPGLVSADEVERLRQNILYSQYEGKAPADISTNQIVTMESSLEQIDNTAASVSAQMHLL